MSYFAFISAVAFCSSVMRDWALGLLDLGVGLLQLRLLLLDRPLQRRCRRTATTTSPGLHHRAVLRQLDDLQLAGLHRRRQHDRLERPDLAADLERVDELALRHLGGRQVGHASRRPRWRTRRPPAMATTTHVISSDDCCARRRSGRRRLGATARGVLRCSSAHGCRGVPTLRATTAPSSRPDVTTASWAFVAPSVTGRSSNRRAALHAHERALAVVAESRRAARRARRARARARRRATRSGPASGSGASR